MLFSRSTLAVGLHVHELGVYGIVLRRMVRHGKTIVRVVAQTRILREAEGLLSDTELQDAVHTWLVEQDALDYSSAGCLAQSEVSCARMSFPSTHSRKAKQEMVNYQAQHLLGLTDESFLSDFQDVETPSQTGDSTAQVKTMLLLAKTECAQQRYDFLVGCGVKPNVLSCEGIALCNAFCQRHPEVVQKDAGVQMVINLNVSAPFAAIFWNGALQMLAELDSVASLKMPLEMEVASFIRKWRSGHPERPMVSALYVCGDAPDLEAAQARLESHFHVKTCILGIGDGVSDNAGAEFAIAYGLALQAMGGVPFALSLQPPGLVEHRRRVGNLLLLRILTILILWCLAVFMGLFQWRYNVWEKDLDMREERLNVFNKLTESLDNVYETISLTQNRLVPFQKIAMRTSVLLKTLELWRTCRPTDSGWDFFLADGVTYGVANRGGMSPSSAAGKTAGRRSGTRLFTTPTPMASAVMAPAVMDLPTTPAARPKRVSSDEDDDATMADMPNEKPQPLGTESEAKKDAESQTIALEPAIVYPPLCPISKIRPVTSFYIGGYTVSGDDAKYQDVKELQERLNATNAFSKVDDCFENASELFVERFYGPWNRFLEAHKAELKHDYTPFLFQLPLAETSHPSESVQEEGAH